MTGAEKLFLFVYLPKQVYVLGISHVIWKLDPPLKVSRGSWDKKEDGCQLFSFTHLLTFRNFFFFFVQDKWMDLWPDCGAELNTSIQSALLG